MTDPRTFKSHQSETSQPEALEKRLATYVLVAGAGLLAAPAAQAGVVYTPTNVTIGPGATYYLNIDGVGGEELRFLNVFNHGVSHVTYGPSYSNWLTSYRGGVAVQGNAASVLGAPHNLALRLPASTVIGPVSPVGTWRSGAVQDMAGAQQGDWGSGSWGYWNNASGYLAFRFDIGGNTHYGWARLSVSRDGQMQHTALLTGYAYESVTGQSIHAGDEGGVIPEPSTLGLLAGGILGLAAWRRRKQKLE